MAYKKKTTLENGTVVYEYGPRQVLNRHKKKADRLESLRHDIEELRKEVQRDLLAGDATALVIRLIDLTAERVGNPASAEDLEHFGVTEWRRKHLSFKGHVAKFNYVGKSGVGQFKTVSDPDVVSVLRNLAEGKDADDPLFPEITSREVNDYLEPWGITAKDLRGFHANTLMQEKLRMLCETRTTTLPEDKAERERLLKAEFMAALEETAQEVGHEATTLRKQYLVPGFEDEFLQGGVVKDKLVKAHSPATPFLFRVASTLYRVP